MMTEPQIQQFQQQILAWFNRSGRKNLPWQQAVTSYRVWVSEIMLQQTQVTTVIPYFQRFMQRFPTIQHLAAAPMDDVLHLWTGLGYYARARNLHRAAQLVCSEYHGEFPTQLEQLVALPGIGRSTAGAILALAQQQHATILDGNVKRVLARHFAIEGWPGTTTVQQQLWDIAERLTPAQQVANYTQAMMDLGAIVCTRSRPQCTECPVNSTCQALASDRIPMLPSKKPKSTLPIRTITFVVVQRAAEILLLQRPPAGLWGGLWGFIETDVTDVVQHCRDHHGITLSISHHGTPFRHTFSHFHLDITPVFTVYERMQTKVMESTPTLWYNLAAPPSVGLAAPVKKLLQGLIPCPD